MPHGRAFAGAAASRGLSIDHPMSDAALVELIAQKDRHAMQVLFARYSARTFRFLMRFVDSEPLAEDLTSETFIDVWRHAGQYEGVPWCRLGCWRSPVTRRVGVAATFHG
jgi:hypothetical protein